MLVGLGVAPAASAANIPDIYTGTGTGNVTTGSNWSLTTAPIISNDAVFNGSSIAGIKNFGSGGTVTNQTVGSYNVTATTGTYTLRNDTTSASNVVLTLGGGGSTGNSVSGTAGDLLYAAAGSTFNLTGTNGNGGTGVLQVALGQSGNFNIAGTSTISAAISGTGFGITKTGAGTLTLTGVNTYTGGTIVDQGTLALGTGSGTGIIRGVVTVNTGATLSGSGGDSLGYTPGVQVTTLNLNGGTFNNAVAGNQGYSTNVTMTGGTLSSTGGGSFYFNVGFGLTSNASSTTSMVSSPIVLGTSNAFAVAVASGTTPSGIDLNITGAISSPGSLVKSGTGVLQLTGTNTYNGVTTISAGTLQLGNGGTTGSVASTTITNNGILNINRSNAVTLAAAIGGSGAFNQIGAGTTTLSGTNGFSGATTVSSGGLQLDYGTNNTSKLSDTASLTLGEAHINSGWWCDRYSYRSRW